MLIKLERSSGIRFRSDDEIKEVEEDIRMAQKIFDVSTEVSFFFVAAELHFTDLSSGSRAVVQHHGRIHGLSFAIGHTRRTTGKNGIDTRYAVGRLLTL